MYKNINLTNKEIKNLINHIDYIEGPYTNWKEALGGVSLLISYVLIILYACYFENTWILLLLIPLYITLKSFDFYLKKKNGSKFYYNI